MSQQFGLDYIGGEEKSPVHLLLFQENVKVWIIKIGFNQSFVCWVIICFFFPGKVLSETAQFRLLPLAELQLSGEKSCIFFRQDSWKVYRGVQWTVQSQWCGGDMLAGVVVVGVGGPESGDWWLLLH